MCVALLFSSDVSFIPLENRHNPRVTHKDSSVDHAYPDLAIMLIVIVPEIPMGICKDVRQDQA